MTPEQFIRELSIIARNLENQKDYLDKISLRNEQAALSITEQCKKFEKTIENLGRIDIDLSELDNISKHLSNLSQHMKYQCEKNHNKNLLLSGIILFLLVIVSFK